MITSNLSVIDVSLWRRGGKKLKIANLSSPIRLAFSKEHVDFRNTTEAGFFLKMGEMHYHSIYIPSNKATVIVRIKPTKNITLLVYISKGSRPTRQQNDFHLTLPKSILESSSNATRRVNYSFSTRDPYEFDFPIYPTGPIGLHFIGIEIKVDSSNIIGTNKSVENRAIDNESCVIERPPPTTTSLIRKIEPHMFDPKTDVNYTFYISMGSCAFWDTFKDEWSTRGCQVGHEIIAFR